MLEKHDILHWDANVFEEEGKSFAEYSKIGGKRC